MTLTFTGAPPFARRTNLVGATTMAVVFVMTVVAIGSRPDGSDWSVWRPASGVAVGVSAWYPPTHAWRIAVGAAVATFAASLVMGRHPVTALGSAIVVALEAWIGSRILRGATGSTPTLSGSAGLRRLFLAVGAIGAIAGIGLGATAAASLGLEEVIPTLLATIPTHMAGVFILAPLFFQSPPSSPPISKLEMVLQWTAVAVSVAFSFRITTGLPIAFLVIPPLVWGASRLPYRMFVLQLALASLAIARTTSNSFGPFGGEAVAGAGAGAGAATLLSGALSLTIGIMVFTIISSSASARRARALLDERERTYRESIESSIMGIAVISEVDGALTVTDVNPAGRAILAIQPDVATAGESVFTAQSARDLLAALRDLSQNSPIAWSSKDLKLLSDQVLEVSLVPLTGSKDVRASLQFIDVTERELVRVEQAAERQRALDIQVALTPGTVPTVPGYDFAGRCVLSRGLGGDFYDFRPVGDGVAVTLGDVMGKGAGAGLIAAALRTSLRLQNRTHAPAIALAGVARAIEEELGEASSFTTVFNAHVRTKDGRIRYADAGHGLALICRPDHSFTQLDSRGIPVGVLPESQWKEKTVQLRPGETLFVFSDGVLDLFDGSLSAFEEISRMSSSAGSAEDLLEQLFSLVDPDAVDDDVTAIAIRRAA